ncbi:MAG: PQQ-dependent sugar dehydrogenase, partial [Actinomycetota bacterium]
MKRWTPPIVPTDLWWYKGKLRALSGNLFMGDYNEGRLHKFVLNSKGTRIRRDRIIYNGGGILDVAKGPGGWLYFLTQSAILRIVR